MNRIVSLLCLWFVALSAPVSIAQSGGTDEAAVRASLSAGAVYIGDSLIYSLEVVNAEPDAPPTFGPASELGFEMEFLRQQNKSFSSTVIINGQVTETSEISYVLFYRLTPRDPGMFEVPSVTVEAGDLRLRTSPVSFRVVGPSQRDDLRASLEVSASDPYVGQPIEVTLEVLIQRGASINNPVFALPGLGDLFSVQEQSVTGSRRSRAGFDFLGAPAEIEVDRVTIEDREFDRVRTSRTIVPQAEGTAEIGPGTWISDFAPTRSRRPARVAVPTNAVTITVRGLPEEGRPRDFTGLIGSYTVSANATPTDVRVGDPIRFELTLEGPGDLRRVPAPQIADLPGFDSSFRLADRDAERRFGDGTVTYRYVIRAITDAVESIPKVVLNYFDPSLGEYALIETEPIPLEVEASRVVTAVDGESFSEPATEAQTVRSARPSLSANRTGAALLVDRPTTLAETVRSPLVIGVAVAPPVAYFGLLAAIAVRRRRQREPQPLDARQAARRSLSELRRDNREPSEAVRAALVRYEALRSAQDDDVVSPGDAVERIRIDHPDLYEQARSLFHACEAARFGGSMNACTREQRQQMEQLLGNLSRTGGAR